MRVLQLKKPQKWLQCQEQKQKKRIKYSIRNQQLKSSFFKKKYYWVLVWKWEVTWTHGTRPNTFYLGRAGEQPLRGRGYLRVGANIWRLERMKCILNGRWQRTEPNLIHFIWSRRANSHLVERNAQNHLKNNKCSRKVSKCSYMKWLYVLWLVYENP